MKTKMHDRIEKDCAEAANSSAITLSALKRQTVFITGGTGFVGIWITELVAFLNDNHGFNTNLILLARNAYNFTEKAPHLALRKDIVLVEKDVRDSIEIPEEVTFIIHGAASPDNRQHVLEPLKVMDVIVKGTDSILFSATRLPQLKKILNISSGLIYGRQPLELDSLPETFIGGPDCNSSASVYSEAKRYAETICSAYRSLYKLPIVIARPFAFIGPYQSLDKPWAINNFIRDALMNYPIRIIGNGKPVRSYMYPSDMAVWLLRLLTDGKPGLAYNVGSPYGISLKELAEKIKELSHAKSEIIIKHMNEDTSKFIPDVRLAKELGLDITVKTDETIKRSINWFKYAFENTR